MALDPLSRPQSVFALQKELSREIERRYTKLSFSERLKLAARKPHRWRQGLTLMHRPHEHCTFAAPRGDTCLPWDGPAVDHEVWYVYQVSRKGGREKNEDRMGYCYTRDSPACSRWPTAWAAIPRARWPRSSRCRRWRPMFQKRLPRPTLEGSAALPAGRHPGRPPPAAALCHRPKAFTDTPRTTIVACRHPGRQRIVLGPLRRFAALPRARRQASSRAPATTRTPSCSEAHVATWCRWMNQPLNRNVLFTCLGSPGKPVIDSGPAPWCCASGDRRAALLGRAVGQRSRIPTSSRRCSRSFPICTIRCPRWWSRRCATAVREERQRHRAGGRMGSLGRGRRQRQRQRVHRARSARTSSRPPSRPA